MKEKDYRKYNLFFLGLVVILPGGTNNRHEFKVVVFFHLLFFLFCFSVYNHLLFFLFLLFIKLFLSTLGMEMGVVISVPKNTALLFFLGTTLYCLAKDTVNTKFHLFYIK